MSLGKPGQSPVVIRPAARSVDGTTAKRSSSTRALMPIRQNRARSTRDPRRSAPRDLDFTAGDRRDHRPAAGLDVVAAQRVRAPRSVLGGPRCESCDVPAPSMCDAHRRQELAQLHDVRLAWRRCESRSRPCAGAAASKRGLRAGHRRLGQIERRAGQAVRAHRARGPGPPTRRRPCAASASRCVRDASGAPENPRPGGARRARPHRASERTEQQHRSTQPPDERRHPARP